MNHADHTLVITAQQKSLGYVVMIGGISNGTIRRLPFRVICKLNNGTFLVKDPTYVDRDDAAEYSECTGNSG